MRILSGKEGISAVEVDGILVARGDASGAMVEDTLAVGGWGDISDAVAESTRGCSCALSALYIRSHN